MSNLRHFTDTDDLFDSIDNEIILGWVNELAKIKASQRAMGTRYRFKQQAFAKLAARLADPDELRRLQELAAEKAEERE